MRGTIGRGILKPLVPLGITVECYYIINSNLSIEYIVYFPREYIEAVREYIKSPFVADPVRSYHSSDSAHSHFLKLSSKFGIESSKYAGFYLSEMDFDKCIGPLTPSVLQGDLL